MVYTKIFQCCKGYKFCLNLEVDQLLYCHRAIKVLADTAFVSVYSKEH